MSKFIQLSNGDIINVDVISHITPVRGSEIPASDELAYTTHALDGKYGYIKCLPLLSQILSQKQRESIAYYIVHLMTPCGGMNYSHVTQYATKDDFMKIKDAIGL